MDGIRHPVGDEPTNVYWKRRLAVVIAIAWFARLALALTRREDAALPAQHLTPGSAAPGNR